MSPEMLTWLSKTGGAAGILILALWLFRDRIYFSFGQPPAGIRFRHPEDPTGPGPHRIAPPGRRKTRQRA
ncbi:hypothetical protein [Longimicrobium sp.]|uniref:hypothetical protein n=1 Tax=Longimicrobium sp. TaxID=2029185 RepID=UPI003B3AF2DB